MNLLTGPAPGEIKTKFQSVSKAHILGKKD